MLDGRHRRCTVAQTSREDGYADRAFRRDESFGCGSRAIWRLACAGVRPAADAASRFRRSAHPAAPISWRNAPAFNRAARTRSNVSSAMPDECRRPARRRSMQLARGRPRARRRQPAGPAPAPAAAEAPRSFRTGCAASGRCGAAGRSPAGSCRGPKSEDRHHRKSLRCRAACRSEFGVHCPGVRPGGSAALRCLQANAAALSPPCRDAVMAMGEGGAPPPAGEPMAAPPAAAPAVAPLGPIPPMRPRKALEILSFCGPEQRALCGRCSAGRRPHHRVPGGKRPAPVAAVLRRDRARGQISQRVARRPAMAKARRSRAWRRPPGPQASPRRSADGCGRRSRNRCRR